MTMRNLLVTIALSLLVASCSAPRVQIAPRSYIQENLPKLLTEEKRHDQLRQMVKAALLMMAFERDVDYAVEMLNGIDGEYWVYYYAAHTYLSSGDDEAFQEALDLMRARMNEAEDWFEAWVKEDSQPEKPKESSDFDLYYPKEQSL